MYWRKTLVNAIVGCSLGLLFCCGGSKQLALAENTEVKEEVNYIPYYLKVYEADSLYLTGNYERSFQILDSLFQVFEPLNQLGVYELETYIKSSYLTNNHNKIKPMVIQLIHTWGYDNERVSVSFDSILPLAWSVANIGKDETNHLEKQYYDKINWTLRDTIIEMYKADQLYRGKDRGKKIMREDSVDLVNIDLLKYIFKKHGYPDFRKIGHPTSDSPTDLSVVYNHISDNLDEKDYQYFQDELLKFLKKGTANPNYITFLVDKRNFDRNEKTTYGTFGTYDSFGHKRIKFDTTEINQNRKSIGYPSVQYEDFKYKILLKMINQ